MTVNGASVIRGMAPQHNSNQGRFFPLFTASGLPGPIGGGALDTEEDGLLEPGSPDSG